MKIKTAKFLDWRVIQSNVDGIDIVFFYTINWITNENRPNQSEHIEEKRIVVSISGERAISWGFQIWQFQRPNYYDELAKVFFEYSKRHIIEKIKNNSLEELERIILLTTNSPEKPPFNPKELDDPKGAEFEIFIQ